MVPGMGTAGLGGGVGLEVTTGAGGGTERERLDRRCRLVCSVFPTMEGSAVWGVGRGV